MNGIKVKQCGLKDGDEISFGPFVKTPLGAAVKKKRMFLKYTYVVDDNPPPVEDGDGASSSSRHTSTSNGNMKRKLSPTRDAELEAKLVETEAELANLKRLKANEAEAKEQAIKEAELNMQRKAKEAKETLEKQKALEKAHEEALARLAKMEAEQAAEKQMSEAAIADLQKKLNEEEKIKKKFEESIEDDILCSICQDYLVRPVNLSCSHGFCESCIHEWLEKNDTCPMCSEPLTCLATPIVNRQVMSTVEHFLKTVAGEDDLKRFTKRNTNYTNYQVAQDAKLASLKKRLEQVPSNSFLQYNEPWDVEGRGVFNNGVS